MVEQEPSCRAPEASGDPVDIVVIGAGIAGLSAAVYARRAGLSVRVFERHSIPGGLCTAWKRSGYLFDYCIDYLFGCTADLGYCELWKELGVIGAVELQHIDAFGRYVSADGRSLDLYTDWRRLQDHLLETAPEDAASILEFCRGISKVKRFLPTTFRFSLPELPGVMRSLPTLLAMRRWAGVSVAEWCRGLKSPLLREAVPALVGGDTPMAGPVLMFGMMSRGAAAYPLGGSLPVAAAVEKRAKSLGAEFFYGLGVRRVIIEGLHATGVELDDGTVQCARHVVAACDAWSAFEHLVGGRIKSDAYERMLEHGMLHRSIVQVSLGVRDDPAWRLLELPSIVDLPVRQTTAFEGKRLERLPVRHYARDPNMAPEGGVSMVVRLESDYDFWNRLRADRKAYKAEKSRVLAETIAALDGHFPGIRGRIEATDVATPVSCERYTGNRRGSTQGWMLTSELMKKQGRGWKLPTSFPDLPGFHLAGQWSEPGGGLPPSARSARDVVECIARHLARDTPACDY